MAGWINGVPQEGEYYEMFAYERCSHCGTELRLHASLVKSVKCVECGNNVKPCSMCDMDKTNCKKCKIK
jgi:PHP family Zn ribbon phosphoesterase